MAVYIHEQACTAPATGQNGVKSCSKTRIWIPQGATRFKPKKGILCDFEEHSYEQDF